MGPMLAKRQGFNDGDCMNSSGCNNDWWWYSPVSFQIWHTRELSANTRQTAAAIKWSIVGAIFVLFLVLFVGGYWHAQRRMKKGLPPLAYHRVKPSQISSRTMLRLYSGFSHALSVLGSPRGTSRSASINIGVAIMMGIK